MITSHTFYIVLSYAACIGILAFMVVSAGYTYFKTRSQLLRSDKNHTKPV